MSLVITTEPEPTVTVEISPQIASLLQSRQQEGHDIEGELRRRIEAAALAVPVSRAERMAAWRRLTTEHAVSGVVVDDTREGIYGEDER